jgi:hypothetical protein
LNGEYVIHVTLNDAAVLGIAQMWPRCIVFHADCV